MISKFLLKSMFKQWKNGDYQVVFGIIAFIGMANIRLNSPLKSIAP